MTASLHDVTDFQTEVLERSRVVPVLVDFWAAWCGPCRVLSPVLEGLAAAAEGRWVLAKVDTEAHPDLARRYGVQGIPNCKLFVDGEVYDEFTGALPERELRRWLDDALPSAGAAAVAEAERLLEAGRFYEAALMLREGIAATPSDHAARVLLGQVLLRLDPTRVDEALEGVEADAPEGDRANALRTLARLAQLTETTEALTDGAATMHVLAAARCLRAGDWDGTLAALIEALRAERDPAAGLVRAAGRAAFVLLGIRHPACERHHRALASALNA